MHLRRNLVQVCCLAALAASAASALAAEHPQLTARATGGEQVDFDIYLPVQHRDQLELLLRDLHDVQSANFGHWLTPEQFHQRFGAADTDVSAMQSELSGLGLSVSRSSSHQFHVSGQAAVVERAFGTILKTGTRANGARVMAATSSMVMPSSLTRMGAVITGLSPNIHMRPMIHTASPQNRYSTSGPYWFTDLKQAYRFPSVHSFSGRGATVGILMSSSFNAPDMDLYFGHEKLKTPSISEVKVKGGAPFDPASGGSGEAHLDIQQAGGMAPDAKIVLYNIPDLSDTNILAGLTRILADNRADVVNMSFGGPEIAYSAAYNNGVDFSNVLQQFDDLFAQGNAQGITFVASSGDQGALAAPPVACFDPKATNCGSYLPSVSFPASSPHVTGVGGTNLVTTHVAGSPNLNSAYVREQAYGDPLAVDIFYGTAATGGYWGSGGGDSGYFPKPLYQYLVKTGNAQNRTVPDVSLHMGGCPGGTISCNTDDSADIEVIGGKLAFVIGTSASAPDFAGLTALAVQRFGHRIGNENYYIYALAAAQRYGLIAPVFRTGIPGYNGLYSTTPKGYNRVLGNGTVDGVNFLLAPWATPAGIPQTPTNP